jgi:hypothetical protein
VCLLLEFLLVVAVAELVCQGTAEASQWRSARLTPEIESILQGLGGRHKRTRKGTLDG